MFRSANMILWGVVRGAKNSDGRIQVEQRGKFLVGDELDVLSPKITGIFTVIDIVTPKGSVVKARRMRRRRFLFSARMTFSRGICSAKKGKGYRTLRLEIAIGPCPPGHFFIVESRSHQVQVSGQYREKQYNAHRDGVEPKIPVSGCAPKTACF